MLRSAALLAAVLSLSVPVCLPAAEQPDLTRQKTWGKKEKDAFYEWLKEQQRNRTSAEENKPVRLQPLEQLQQTPGTLSSRYLSPRFAAYGLLGFMRELPPPPEEGGTEGLVPGGEIDARIVGLELQYGKPIKTWFRQLYGLGVYKGSAEWHLPDPPSPDAGFSLYRFGYHLELALVPLGLDQTRNIVLRGGVNLLYGRKGGLAPVEAGNPQSERLHRLEKIMLDQVTGLQAGLSWSVGYEWQMGENFWRVHGTIDGFKAFHLPRDSDREDYAAVGLGAGVSRIF